MILDIKNLYETWFADLDLAKTSIPTHRIPTDDRGYKPWRCACNKESRFLVTQLISKSAEMRDGQYYYCLLINDNAYTFEDLNDGSFLAQGNFNIEAISEAEIQSILRIAARMLFDNAKKG